jgi:hypothetical protein
MVSNRWKYFLTFAAVSAVLLACGVVVAVSVVVRLFEDLHARRPTLRVPPVEQWNEIPLSIDPALHCPTPVACRVQYQRGSYVVADTPCCDWQFDVFVSSDGEKSIHMSTGDGNDAEVLDFVMDAGGQRTRVFGRAIGGTLETALQGLAGSITVNTLDWLTGTHVHVHFQLNYYFDDSEGRWTIEVCSEGVARRGSVR